MQHRCPKCRGMFFLDGDGQFCINCGYRPLDVNKEKPIIKRRRARLNRALIVCTLTETKNVNLAALKLKCSPSSIYYYKVRFKNRQH